MGDSSAAIARDTGEAIGRLPEMAQGVAQVVGDVDVALREQSAASNDVAQKIEDVASQAEESSAIAHETSRAADSMMASAHGMQELVARFRVSCGCRPLTTVSPGRRRAWRRRG